MPFVRTDDNIADFFTKPLPARKFYEMRRRIMNERTVSGSQVTGDAEPRGGVRGR